MRAALWQLIENSNKQQLNLTQIPFYIHLTESYTTPARNRCENAMSLFSVRG
jgi:hypothetical protein